MTKYEQETVINFNELEKVAEVYTSSPRVARALLNKGLKPYRTESLEGKEVGWFFKLPKHSVILKPCKHMIRIGGRSKNGCFGCSKCNRANTSEV